MPITRITGFAIPFSFRNGPFTASYGPRYRLENLLVRITADDGVEGYGEVCKPSGSQIAPTDPEFWSVARDLARQIIADETDAEGALDAVFDRLSTPPAIRHGVSAATLDLLGRRHGISVYSLLGGSRTDRVPLYGTVGNASPDAMAAAAAQQSKQGISLVQMKIGTAFDRDLEAVQAVLDALPAEAELLADANGGWTEETAATALRSIRDPRLIWEEPCRTYSENRRVAERTGARVMLDQCLSTLSAYANLGCDGFAAGAGIKPTVLGGMRRAAVARDLCVEFGIHMKVDDAWCTSLGSAACLAVAVGASPGLVIGSLDMGPYMETCIANTDGARPYADTTHYLAAASPGIGLTPDLTRLPAPLFDVTR